MTVHKLARKSSVEERLRRPLNPSVPARPGREVRRAALRRANLPYCSSLASVFPFPGKAGPLKTPRPPIWFRPAQAKLILCGIFSPFFRRHAFNATGPRNKKGAFDWMFVPGLSHSAIPTRRVLFLEKVPRATWSSLFPVPATWSCPPRANA